ncbi:c-type cytochrome biogenesis protein CcmI [Tranquillimonas alkanivorans]|nr:c-type cytochrome biogenesis protein CcmI [Tranquillimonas alkanivorans]
MFFGLMGLLSAILMAFLPLRAARADTAPAADGVGVFVDQLDEVERDLERGLISEDEARSATAEIKRRLLAASRRDTGHRAPSGGRSAIFVAALLVPLAAAGYYTLMGAPGVASAAFAERGAERAQAEQIADLSERLRERLESAPDGGPSEGWMLLGQTYLRMGRFDGAARAFATVAERDGEATSATFSLLAEALIAAESGIVTPRAERALERALTLDPSNPAASFYRAIALEQAGKLAEAHETLVARLEAAEGPAPWMQSFIAQANRIGEALDREPLTMADFAPMLVTQPRGPSAADVAAAQEMSEEDRSAFIRSMVDRLAARLEQQPEDLDGWLRLGNAYRVLGETDAARDAYLRAKPLLNNVPEADPRRGAVQDALAALDDRE